MANVLTLAAAGSRKTQGIIDYCAAADPAERILILTYTAANQQEIRARLSAQAGYRPNVRVCGWFSFLIGDIVRPYVPLKFRGRRVAGFDFHSPPTKLPNESPERYFTRDGSVRRVHLAQLAKLVEAAGRDEALRALARTVDRIFIDEVQDLNGYDLDILDLLFRSGIDLHLVGDVRQAILQTNPQEQRNRQFKLMAVWEWFRTREREGHLRIVYSSDSHRCSAEICRFADSLFGADLGFPPTRSVQEEGCDHEGIYLLRREHLRAYCDEHEPLFLRHSKTSGSYPGFSPMNIGDAKGMTCRHVLIHPTGPVSGLLKRGIPLDGLAASRLYVAVTRAMHSVTFILDDGGDSRFPYWAP